MADSAQKLSFAGKNVLVTGASKGIGRSIALGFASCGANVSICARGAERLLRSREARELIGEAGAAVTRLPGLQTSEARNLVRQMVKP